MKTWPALRLALGHWSFPCLVLFATAWAHPWLESTMARHMGIELPLLFMLGWLCARCAGPRLEQALRPWNAHGLPALLLALLVTAFWMVPAALDRAVLDWRVGELKVMSLVAAGITAGATWRTAGPIIQAFFVLNWSWMTLVAGLLYQESAQQVCSVYLIDEQRSAGVAMVCWSVAGTLAWLHRVIANARFTIS